MKKLNKKEWGIISTSIGSILIMVALLTMVGIGSNDTYAANTVTVDCTCPDEYNRILGTAKCTKTAYEEYQCCTGISCKEHTGVEYCSSTEGCTETSHKEVGLGSTKHTVYVYSCSKKTTTSADCTCANGTPDSTGACQSTATDPSSSSEQTYHCEPGTYFDKKLPCKDCMSGYLCPGGDFKSGEQGGIIACPDNGTCEKSILKCNDGYKAVGYQCVKDETSSSETTIDCKPGTYFDGKTKNCPTCPKGSYCPGTTLPANTTLQGTAGLFKCPTGKTTNTTGAESDTYCIDDPEKTCDDGSYKTVGGYCEICPAGSYCKNGMKYDCPTNTKQGQSTCGSTTTCTSKGAKCTLNGKSGTCIDSGSNVGGLVCKIETSGSDDGGDPNPPSGGDPSSGGNPNTPSGGDSGGNSNGNGNTNQNPNTATKTPLVIAIIGTMSMVLGTFAYFKGKKEINTEI